MYARKLLDELTGSTLQYYDKHFKNGWNMDPHLIALIIAATCNILLGVFLLMRGPHLRSMQSLFVMMITSAIWVMLYFFAEEATNIKINTFCNSLTYAAAYVVVLSFTIFAYFFAHKRSFSKRWVQIGMAVFLIGLLLSATELVTGTVYYDEQGKLAFENGPLLVVYGGFLILMSIASIKSLYYVYSHSSGRERTQTRMMLLGFSVAIFLGLILNILFPIIFPDWRFANYGPLSSVILLGTIAYSVARFGPYDVSPLVVRSIAYGLTTSVIAVGATIISYRFLELAFGLSVSADQIMYIALFFAVCVLLFLPVKHLFDKLLDAAFGNNSYDSQKMLNAINTKIATTSDLNELLSAIAALIERKLRVESCSFYLQPHADIEFHIVSSRKRAFAHTNWDKFDALMSGDISAILSYQDMSSDEPLGTLMKELNISLVVRMNTNDENVGYMIIGHKRSNGQFSASDFELLHIVAGELALVVQNYLRFREIKRFNETLEQKVEAATQELRKNNQKLRTLDDAKDEFISMASHQLRTPLTSIKGYVAMLLDGDAGEMSDTQRAFLNQVLTSSQHMVYTIGDLLNLSRLKTGKFLIEPTDVYLPEIIKTEVDQLMATAEARGLSLECKLPDTFPHMRLDDTKMHQVIMNFIDNAIHYTRSGDTIMVRLYEKDDRIEFRVKDNGIGVPVSEQHSLFNKFFRATNARRARPDGTGLGLFMAKKIIVAQGGVLIFQSKEGEGSTFGFTFPKTRIAPPSAGLVPNTDDTAQKNVK